MGDMKWEDAITKVLEASDSAMHYTAIAKEIVDRELRSSVGATPEKTVSVAINNSLRSEGAASPFIRVGMGLYWLRKLAQKAQEPEEEQIAESREAGLIKAFGMYWQRDAVDWAPTKPDLWGIKETTTTRVNFAEQRGVYLLHDIREVIYVGKVTDQPLSSRLRYHTQYRLRGRWDRFSWFGIIPVLDSGALGKADKIPDNASLLITTMEAVLIEAMEPRLNRRRGDTDMESIEFLQYRDPTLESQAFLKKAMEMVNTQAQKGVSP